MLNLQGNGNLDLEEFLDVKELLNQTRRVYETSNKVLDVTQAIFLSINFSQ